MLEELMNITHNPAVLPDWILEENKQSKVGVGTDLKN